MSCCGRGRTFPAPGRSFSTCFVLWLWFGAIVQAVGQGSVRPKPSYLDSSCENDYLFKVV